MYSSLFGNSSKAIQLVTSPEIAITSNSWLHWSELNITKSPFHFKAQTFANKLDQIHIHNIELILILLDK